MEQFTFYELYADILQNMDDISAGKLANCICAYEFEEKEPVEELSDKENFYWSNIADVLKEVKETESAGKIPKKYNLQSRHFTFYETYYNAMKLMNIRKRGVFVKAICAYMFGNEESSLMIYQRWGAAKYQYRCREFWCRGYYVDTVTYFYGQFLQCFNNIKDSLTNNKY